MYDVTRSWRDSFVTWLVRVIYMVHIIHNSTYICVTWLVRDVTRSWRDSFVWYTWCTLSILVHINAHVFHTYTHMIASHHILGSYHTLSSGWSKSAKTYTHMLMYFTLSCTRTSHVTFLAVATHFQADGRSQWKQIHTCTCISHVRTRRSHDTFWAVTTHFRADGPSQWKHIQTRQCVSQFYKYERVMSHFWAVAAHFRAYGRSSWKTDFDAARQATGMSHEKKSVSHEVESVLHKLKSVLPRHDGWILTRILTKDFVTNFDAILRATGMSRYASCLMWVRLAAAWWMDFDEGFCHELWRDIKSDRYVTLRVMSHVIESRHKGREIRHKVRDEL